MILPNLFVIGAPKCGTTSLHLYLDQHPDVSMSSVKEPWVFAYPDYRSRAEAYAEMLSADARVRGESSAVYSMDPHFPGVPERIAAMVPDARFVYLVRDPLERAVSHFVQLVTDGKEVRSMAEALADVGSRENVYVSASRYATQLRRYLNLFDRERFLVVDQDRLRSGTPEVMAEVFAFLDVDPSYSSAAFSRRLNTGEEHRVATPLGQRMAAARAMTPLRRWAIPAVLRTRLRRLTSQRVRRPRLDPEQREELVGALGEEVSWLREFTGQRFESWAL